MKNIILITIECLRPKNMSLFGYKKQTDKNLKKFAHENIFFSQYYSVSNGTMPSLTSLFTGKYPSNIGMVHQIPYITKQDIEKLKKNKFWFPIYLRDKGYETMSLDLLGLWLKRGFNYHPLKEEKRESKIKEFLRNSFIRKILLHLPNSVYKMGKKITKKRLSPKFPDAKTIVNSSILKIKNSQKPFFLFMRFEDTHFPFLSLKKTRASKKNDVRRILEKVKTKSQKEYIKKRFSDVKLNSIQDIINKYDSGLKIVDQEIGRLFSFLKKENLWEDTLIIILGDHGENFEGNGVYFSRAGLYDDSMHTPLMIRLPGLKAKERKEFIQNVDIVPTILDYLNLENKEKFDGKSALSLIKNGTPIRNKVFSFDCFSDASESIRSKNRKLIISKNPTCYLCKAKHHKNYEEYDLEKDPHEFKNIYSKKSKLEKFLKLNN